MTRGLDASVTTPFRSETPKPVWLVKIATGLASPTHLYFTDDEVAVTFDGQTYSPRAIEPPEQRFEDAAEGGSLRLEIGDVAGDLVAHVNAGAFENQRVSLYLTNRTVLEAAGTASLPNTYVCESADVVEGAIVLNLRPLFGVFQIQVPLRTFTRAAFPGLPPHQFA